MIGASIVQENCLLRVDYDGVLQEFEERRGQGRLATTPLRSALSRTRRPDL